MRSIPTPVPGTGWWRWMGSSWPPPAWYCSIPLKNAGNPTSAASPCRWGGPGYLSRLVIAPAYRGRGLAEAFDQARMAFLRESGVVFALAASFLERVARLHRQGWVQLGPVVWRTAGPLPPIPNHHLCLWQPGPLA